MTYQIVALVNYENAVAIIRTNWRSTEHQDYCFYPPKSTNINRWLFLSEEDGGKPQKNWSLEKIKVYGQPIGTYEEARAKLDHYTYTSNSEVEDELPRKRQISVPARYRSEDEALTADCSERKKIRATSRNNKNSSLQTLPVHPPAPKHRAKAPPALQVPISFQALPALPQAPRQITTSTPYFTRAPFDIPMSPVEFMYPPNRSVDNNSNIAPNESLSQMLPPKPTQNFARTIGSKGRSQQTPPIPSLCHLNVNVDVHPTPVQKKANAQKVCPKTHFKVIPESPPIFDSPNTYFPGGHGGSEEQLDAPYNVNDDPHYRKNPFLDADAGQSQNTFHESNGGGGDDDDEGEGDDEDEDDMARELREINQSLMEDREPRTTNREGGAVDEPRDQIHSEAEFEQLTDRQMMIKLYGMVKGLDTRVRYLTEYVKSTNGQDQHGQVRADPVVNVAEEFPELPMKTIEDLKAFDERIQNEEPQRKKLFAALKGIGGSDGGDKMRNMLKHIVTNSLAKQYCYQGKGKDNKPPFNTLYILSMMQYVIRKTGQPTFDNQATKKVVENWLRNAGKRHASEMKKAAGNTG